MRTADNALNNRIKRTMILHRLAPVLQTNRHKLDMPHKFYVPQALNFTVLQYVCVFFYDTIIFIYFTFFFTYDVMDTRRHRGRGQVTVWA